MFIEQRGVRCVRLQGAVVCGPELGAAHNSNSDLDQDRGWQNKSRPESMPSFPISAYQIL